MSGTNVAKSNFRDREPRFMGLSGHCPHPGEEASPACFGNFGCLPHLDGVICEAIPIYCSLTKGLA